MHIYFLGVYIFVQNFKFVFQKVKNSVFFISKFLGFLGLQLNWKVATHFFQISFQVLQIFSRFLKVLIFGSIFSLKLSLRLKTMLNSI